MFDHMHWSMWVLFFAMLVALVVFAFYCIVIEPAMQRRRIAEIQRQQECYEYVLHLLKHPHHDFDDVTPRWKELSAAQQKDVLEQLPTLLVSEDVDTYALVRKFRSLKKNAFSALVPHDVRTAIARASIERTPNGLDVYELACEAWGSKKIPTDMLLLIMKDNFNTDSILENELTEENRGSIVSKLAENGDVYSLGNIFPESIPDEALRSCLAALVAQRETAANESEKMRIELDILKCRLGLKDWEGMKAMLTKEDLLEVDEVQDLIQETTPNEGKEIVAGWLASCGLLYHLITFYNKEDEDEGENVYQAPKVVPPAEHLRTCLEENIRRLEDGSEYEQDAARCCSLLNDWEQARDLLPRLKCKTAITDVLLTLYENNQSIPLKAAETTPA